MTAVQEGPVGIQLGVHEDMLAAHIGSLRQALQQLLDLHEPPATPGSHR